MGVAPARGLARWGAFLALLVLLGASGCGPGSVSGKVSYKGTPLKGGNVTFVAPQGGRSVSASIQDDGTYTMAGVPPGPVTVCVETASLKPQPGNQPHHYSPPNGQKSPYEPSNSVDSAKRYVPIPEKYSNPDSSGLSYTVKSGRQTYDIDLSP